MNIVCTVLLEWFPRNRGKKIEKKKINGSRSPENDNFYKMRNFNVSSELVNIQLFI